MKSYTFAAFAAMAAISPAFASPKVVQMDVRKPNRRSVTPAQIQRRAKSVGANLDNSEILGIYAMNISVGTPGQTIGVQLDTGSSDLWVPQSKSNACDLQTSLCGQFGSFDPDKSSSFKDDKLDFDAAYGDGTQVSGGYINDTIAFNGVTVKGVQMGLATDAQTDFPLAGILGIGYSSGEALVIEDEKPKKQYPNVVEQMRDQGIINTQAYSLWLNDLESSTGSILFGGVDTAKFEGNLISVPVQKDQDGKFNSLQVAWTSISFNGDGQTQSIPMDNFPQVALLDSGTTTSALPQGVVEAIFKGLGVVNDTQNGPLLACNDGTDSSAYFSFGFGGTGGPVVNVSLAELLTPVTDEQNNTIPLPDGEAACSFGLQNGAEEAGLTILGDAFLRSAYVVYDLDNNQIALAQTKFNVSDSNIQEISGSSLPGASSAPSTVSVAMASETGSPATQGHHSAATASATSIGGASQSPTFKFSPTTTATVASQTSSKSAASSPTSSSASVQIASIIVCLTAALSAVGGAMITFF